MNSLINVLCIQNMGAAHLETLYLINSCEDVFEGREHAYS